ncbi:MULTISPECIES: hypothetical protein [Burkholderia]|uniref:hypothetical protein n=1 Tax=Burkholderia TaxID=32008 RepID=UPI000A989DAF|nr:MULTISPECIES: hypothetical protein [Burkholderia]
MKINAVQAVEAVTRAGVRRMRGFRVCGCANSIPPPTLAKPHRRRQFGFPHLIHAPAPRVRRLK